MKDAYYNDKCNLIVSTILKIYPTLKDEIEELTIIKGCIIFKCLGYFNIIADLGNGYNVYSDFSQNPDLISVRGIMPNNNDTKYQYLIVESYEHKFGILDSRLKWVANCEYKEIIENEYTLELRNGYAVGARSKEEYIYPWELPCIYHSIEEIKLDNASQYRISVNKGEELFNEKGQIIKVDLSRKKNIQVFQDFYIVRALSGGYGITDSEGNTLLDFYYEGYELLPQENYIIFNTLENGKRRYGVINNELKKIVPCCFHSIVFNENTRIFECKIIYSSSKSLSGENYTEIHESGYTEKSFYYSTNGVQLIAKNNEIVPLTLDLTKNIFWGSNDYVDEIYNSDTQNIYKVASFTSETDDTIYKLVENVPKFKALNGWYNEIEQLSDSLFVLTKYSYEESDYDSRTKWRCCTRFLANSNYEIIGELAIYYGSNQDMVVGKNFICNRLGQITWTCDIGQLFVVSKDIILYRRGPKDYVFINFEGEQILEDIFDNATVCHGKNGDNNTIIVHKDKKYGLLDNNCRYIFELDKWHVELSEYGKEIYLDRKGDDLCYNTNSGEITSCSLTRYDDYGGYDNDDSYYRDELKYIRENGGDWIDD